MNILKKVLFCFLGVLVATTIIVCSVNNRTKINLEQKCLLEHSKKDDTIINNYGFVYDDLSSRFPEERNDLIIESIKELYDFENNKYHLVEFYPAGYVIYSNDYSMILEISNEAESPYKNISTNLVYLGFLNYFYYSNMYGVSKITHCIKNYDVELNADNINKVISLSRDLNDKIEITSNKIKEVANLRAQLPDEYATLNSQSTITSTFTTGFNVNDNCGYVAGALLLFYAAKVWGRTYLYDGYFMSNQLVVDLQNGRIPDSYPHDLEDALNDYMNSKNDPHSAKVNMWLLPAAHTIYDRVEEDKPVEIFCNMVSPSSGNSIDHAFVVHKVKRSVETLFWGIRNHFDYVLTVHMGWTPQYNSIQVSYDAITVGGLVNLHKASDDL